MQNHQQKQNPNMTQADAAGDGAGDFSDERLGLGVLGDTDDSDNEGRVGAAPDTFAPPTESPSLFTPKSTPTHTAPTPERPISPPLNQMTKPGTDVSKRYHVKEDTLVEKGADTDSKEGEGTATPTTSQRKLRAPKGKQQTSTEHAHIPNLPPPEKSKTGSRKKGQEDGVDCASSSEDSRGGDKNSSPARPKEQDDDEEEKEEEDEPLNSGDDLTSEDEEKLFQ
ncbi:unnamed protein product [Hymenolepis diminuta]|uniref:BLVR domain-containing protein n=1 Tax=Hymenolepis diminuta TaxID=6216 RepID=A0A0R3SAB6_HYMDI|nr:unnamed protein product [Hymenolepis diminuta]